MGKIKAKKSFVRELVDWIFCIVVAFAVALLVRYFIFTPTLVKQSSMTPTIVDGERVLINRLARTFKYPLFRGDIITFERPDETDMEKGIALYDEKQDFWDKFIYNVLEIGKTSYIKRVIGVAGDHVLIKNGKVYINDKLQSEVYLNGIDTPIKDANFYNITVPEGYVFAMGDNRNGSIDSRVFGCIPLDKVEGKVTIRIWPFSAFGKIDK